MEAYNVKMKINAVTAHDLAKILNAFLDEDYWQASNKLDIETIEIEE